MSAEHYAEPQATCRGVGDWRDVHRVYEFVLVDLRRNDGEIHRWSGHEPRGHLRDLYQAIAEWSDRDNHPPLLPPGVLMITRSHFVSEFDVAIADLPTVPPDHAFSAEGAGSRVVMVAVEPWGEPSWTAAFAGPDPGRRALSALLGTPRPTGLCVVERGTAFLGDVLEPESFRVVATPGPVVDAAELPREATLVLITPWAIAAVGEGGVLWTTPRIAVDGLRVDEASHGWLGGVADPEDDEPRDFTVDLATGRLTGGAAIA
jgi:hypothetical protein